MLTDWINNFPKARSFQRVSLSLEVKRDKEYYQAAVQSFYSVSVPSQKRCSSGTLRVRVTLLLQIYRKSVLLGDKSLVRLTTSNFIFQLNTCGYSLYVTSSLRIGWVCRLQLLLLLSSTVILRFESRGTHDQEHLLTVRESICISSPPLFQSRLESNEVIFVLEYVA
jgi:hypothetical protein